MTDDTTTGGKPDTVHAPMSVPFQIVQTDRDLTAAEAHALTRDMRKAVADLELMVVRAYQGRVWLALGYESWDGYVEGEFSKPPLALPREERRVSVQSLRTWGLSQRAIASATGVDPATVNRDVKVLRDATPDDRPNTTTGLDGKEYPAANPKPEPSRPPAPETTKHCRTCTCGEGEQK